MATDKLAALVSQAQLRSLVVVEQHLVRRDWSDPNLGDFATTPVAWSAPNLGVYPAPAPALATDRLLYVVRAQLQDEGPEPVYDLVVAMRVDYACPAGAATPDLVVPFGNNLARHHAWPILRERLMSLALMSGLQPPILDLNQRPQF